jgi:MoaA/NifB/PqqE/SkfB family radical SAM enzyme
MIIPPKPFRALGRSALAYVDPKRPVLAQLVVTRRCNLACGYCNEFDNVSQPVPTQQLEDRIDHLAKLGTLVVTLTGGEPLLHPELDRLVARVVARGMVCTTITNGYPLTRRWIERLNEAQLTLVQISIDNLAPNDVSQKSLSKLRGRLDLLGEHARFDVNVNAVLGACPPDDTRALVDAVEALGFYMTVGVMHDSAGQLDPGLAGDALADLYREMRGRMKKSVFHRAGEGWEDEMIQAGAAPFKCRAGARYLYIDEFGRVSYCSQRRGDPGIDLLEYGSTQLRTAFHTPKGCEEQCTIGCARRASAFDRWRGQRGAPAPLLSPSTKEHAA